ncbi:uncharacterized protein LOC125189309 [Salvia hispanica]|uniref:uncharacterized protein LOC125189309 n=1 Tax=Salvia hispanica TaxID=49212 RepID=UPI0020090298|nr:uncharacterized protein LOC125189309 [Salvia hispanica]
MERRSPRTPRESVYRPYIDLLADDSPSTVPETQYADIETFSFEDLGLSPIRETPDEAEPAARGRSKGKGKVRGGGRGKGKGKVPSSSSHTGAEEEEGEDETERRTIWSVWENAALAKAWIGVVEDPYVGANQYVDRMWHRISATYRNVKPSGAKPRTPEQCRKQWLRLRPKLSRFAALYQNNMRMVTSGMSRMM